MIHTSIVKLAPVFRNTVWIDEVFLPTHQQRLREAANKTRNTLVSLGVQVRPAQAGFFLWADFRRFLPVVSRDEELGKCTFAVTSSNGMTKLLCVLSDLAVLYKCCLSLKYLRLHSSVVWIVLLSFLRCHGSIMKSVSSPEACR
jgi:hypothetical protein